MCTPALSAECGRSSGRGCPYPVSSSAATRVLRQQSRHVRMGYWWNRQYCKGDLRRPPYNRGLHYIERFVRTTRQIALRRVSAWKVATFKNRSGPLPSRLSQVCRWPSTRPTPSRLATTAACQCLWRAASPPPLRTETSRDDPHFGDVLWPGSTLGFGSLSQQSSAFYDDLPWANKTSRIAWRGAATGCWDTARACPNRDIPGTVPATRAASQPAAAPRVRVGGRRLLRPPASTIWRGMRGPGLRPRGSRPAACAPLA